MTVEAYMEACNAFYYATRDPLGARGDFTTAPEISQMFGEMAGACLADSWKRAGAPADAVYAELGPGRGTLAADALRVLRSAGFAGEVHFVETSPVLRDMQKQAVPTAHWHERVDDLPAQPLLLVANEFLDALPIRQHSGGIERRVMVAAGGLAFDRDGEIIESSPARDEAIASIALCLSTKGGTALIIDYGHAKSAAGDSQRVPAGRNPTSSRSPYTLFVDVKSTEGGSSHARTASSRLSVPRALTSKSRNGSTRLVVTATWAAK